VPGDVIFTRGSLLRLLEPFSDPAIGMTGGRPVPTNPRSGVIGNAVNILWDIHHELSLTKPKLGEAVAFRRVFHTIDSGTLVDEALMEHVVIQSGMQLRYVPDAIVRNHGPETLGEFMAQRSRIYRGHLALQSATGYCVSSMDIQAAAGAAWRLLRRGRAPHYMLITMALEMVARAREKLARLTGLDIQNGIWHPIVSSKQVIAPGHVLRSHHDAFHTIMVRPVRVGTGDERRAIRDIQCITRADDRIRLARGNITVKVRTDADGALALCKRLGEALPHLLPIFDHRRINGVSGNGSSNSES
jgi:hypothetical protein